MRFSLQIQMKNYFMNIKHLGSIRRFIEHKFELHLSKTCEIEKDRLVDKTTQQAEQIRKSIQNLDMLSPIISLPIINGLYSIDYVKRSTLYQKWLRIARSYFSSKHKKCAQVGSISIL